MSLSGSVRHSIKAPRNVVLLLALAVAVVGFTCWQNWRYGPEQQHIDKGEQLLAQRQGAAAEREWREAIRLAPLDAAPWELLGDYYLAISNWTAALDAFRHVQELRPNTANLNPRLSLAALQAGDAQTAQQYSDLALKQNPQDITALKVAAAVAEKNAKADQQLKYLRQLVTLQPQDPTALLALADALASQYQYQDALPLLDQLLKLDPHSTSAYLLRGQIYFQDNPTPARLAQAEADFKEVLLAAPDNIQARGYLGRIYMSLNRPKEAINQLEAIGRDRPYASGHLFELSKAYRQAGNVRKAEELMRRYATLKQLNQQMVELLDRIGKDPNDFTSYLQMARLLLSCVESSEATYQFYRYRYLKQGVPSVAYYLVKASELRPGDTRVQAVAQQVERIYQEHLRQGLLAVQHRDYERADWHLGRAVLLRPDDPRTRQAMLKFAR
ncbi:MAG: tetratricopeptide repeat protein [Abitibacteriaceae bacterium]|nr:tetratricopeptide repeat protein [Abditibacteriaceae bacterium]MBV9864003.1 tetratricopeptide repeat protein [Abditibacteriaceae bacterium]